MIEPQVNGHDEDFLRLLEDSVRSIVKNRKSTKDHKLQAINAGAKLLAIRHKINDSGEKGFFDK